MLAALKGAIPIQDWSEVVMNENGFDSNPET